MIVSFNWLKELVGIDLPPEALAERLTIVGIAVDRIEKTADDVIFELDLTSNRPDCLGHVGVAREISLICDTPLRIPEARFEDTDPPISDLTSVEIEDLDLCPRYTAKLIKGVKIGPSPEWLVRRLETVGQRSVNNVADATNYVLFELGHPTHAFDVHRLVGHRIVVRRARAGETLVTLDGQKRALTASTLVIADAENPVALAGVMGGQDSEITERTADILLESAYFLPSSIRATSRALGLSTEASYRFERGADFSMVLHAAQRCAQLIQQVAGGEIVRGTIDVNRMPEPPRPITLRRSRIKALSGLDVSPEQVEKILKSLGFHIERLLNRDQWMVMPASFRRDVEIEEDLVEEIARHSGYDRIALTLPPSSGSGHYQPSEEKQRTVRQTLATLGFHEAISFSFVDGRRAMRFREEPEAVVRIRNPIVESVEEMRTTLLGGLLDAVERNFSHGERDLKLFEFGKCFRPAPSRHAEQLMLAATMTGLRNPLDWRSHFAGVAFEDVKGILEIVLGRLGCHDFRLRRERVRYLHPGRSAVIEVNGSVVGVIGQLHPSLLEDQKVKQAVYAIEIDFQSLLDHTAAPARYQPLPRFPSVTRDLSFVVPEGVEYGELASAIRGLGIGELRAVSLFDVYSGKGVEAGFVSMSVNLVFRADSRTLTDEEAGEAMRRVVGLLERDFHATLRG